MSEGNGSLRRDIPAQPILANGLGNNIDRSPQNAFEPAFQFVQPPEVAKTASGRIVRQADKYVDIGIAATVSSRRRSDQRQALYSSRPQLVLMGAEPRYDLIPVHDDNLTRPNTSPKGLCIPVLSRSRAQYFAGGRASDSPARTGPGGLVRYTPARAFAMKSVRSAFFQSGTAEIFFSFSRTSAWWRMYGSRSVGKPGSTSTLPSAFVNVSIDIL